MSLKVFILDGNNFSDIEGFYNEIDKILTKNLGWKTRSLDGYNDLLCGGFGVHEYGEPIVIKWLNFKKSRRELGDDFILKALEITLDCDKTDHNCKLELY